MKHSFFAEAEADSLAGGGGAPEFTYTGEFEILENGKDWCIAFKTSGDFEISKLKGAEGGIDVFICGGGGNGGQSSQGYYAGVSYYGGGGGGGGGYRETFPGILVAENTIYPIAIGGVSGDSSAFGNTKGGGSTGGKDWGRRRRGRGRRLCWRPWPDLLQRYCWRRGGIRLWRS